MKSNLYVVTAKQIKCYTALMVFSSFLFGCNSGSTAPSDSSTTSSSLIKVIAGAYRGQFPSTIPVSPTSVNIVPSSIVVDSNGNKYITDFSNRYIEQIDYSTGLLSVIAGNINGSVPTTTPVSPTSVNMLPASVALDIDGNKYIADYGNQYLEIIDHTTGLLNVIAGNHEGSIPTTTPVSPTSVNITPTGVAVDLEQNIYIADITNHYIEKIDHSTGLLSVIAGNNSGTEPTTTPTSPTSVEILPRAVTVDESGNIYISDDLGYIEKIDHSTGLLAVIAGNHSGIEPTTTPTSPTAVIIRPRSNVSIDISGSIYIADANGFIEKIDHTTGLLSVIAGSSTGEMPSATPVSPLSVKILPEGVAADNNGNIYIADGINYNVEEINSSTGLLNVIAGNNSNIAPTTTPTSPTLVSILPSGTIKDKNGNMYIADFNGYVEKVDHLTGLLSIIAGEHGGSVPTISPVSPTSVNILPYKVSVDSNNNLYIADTLNHYIEKIDYSTGLLSVIAGNNSGSTPTATPASPTSVKLLPSGVTVDSSNNIYITDAQGYIEKIDHTTGLLSVIAGNNSGSSPTTSPTPAMSVKISPAGISIDANNNIYFSDSRSYVEQINKDGALYIIAGNSNGITPSTTPLSPTSLKITPLDVAVSANNNIYISDFNGYIEEVNSSTGLLNIIAGNNIGAVPSTTQSNSTSVRISPVGVSIDSNGDVYSADSFGYVEAIMSSNS